MCGIAGYIASETPSAVTAKCKAMLSALKRRGPDGEGLDLWCTPEDLHVGLAHRRLAIIDLSPAGHQPMISDDRQTGLVFNGCVFNFMELRHELEQAGCVFHSHCDTEVLLHGYREWGAAKLVKRCQGMFAFVVWDQARQTLTMVRDRLGVKPLYFMATAQRVAFASTAGALKKAGLTGEISPASITEYLEFGYVTDQSAIYKGVEKVQPGEIITWSGGQVKRSLYWTPPDPEAPRRKISFDQAVEETETLLLDAVKGRLISDVPVGALLSGGIDSALVCWAITQLNANIRAFTVATPGDPADESAAARETAQILGISHEVVDLGSQEEPNLDELIDAYSEPFACSSALGMLRVSRAVKSHATVLLTGDGGDDFFLGYPYHKHMALAQRLALVTPEQAGPAWLGVRHHLDHVPFLRRHKHLADYVTGGLGSVTRVKVGFPYFAQRGLLGPMLPNVTVRQRQIPRSVMAGRRVLEDLVLYDLKTQFAGEYLPKVDGTTMYCGIEARSPFLDYRLAELALSVPWQVRLNGRRLKAILRELARRKMGDKVAYRPKAGFTIPVESWLAEKWSPALRAINEDSPVCRQGWIDAPALQRNIQQALDARSVHVKLWYVLVLNAWLSKNS
jgi:asparagine synthase (glutamine-hydrolysing)